MIFRIVKWPNQWHQSCQLFLIIYMSTPNFIKSKSIYSLFCQLTIKIFSCRASARSSSRNRFYSPKGLLPSIALVTQGSSENLAESCRILQNLAESCRIMQNLAESCRILQNLAESCRILQNLAKSCRILQNLAESCRILQNLAESCRILQNHAESCRILQNLAKQYNINPFCRQRRNEQHVQSCSKKVWVETFLY